MVEDLEGQGLLSFWRFFAVKQDMVYPENAQAIKDNAGKPARDVQRIEFHSDQVIPHPEPGH